jgi:hypothetical protein
MAYIGKQPLVGNYISCDSLSASATTTYNLASSGTPVFPTVPQNCIVSLNGVVQAPVTSFTISGSTIIFSTTLSTTDSIDYITVLGSTLNIGTPSNNTVGLSQLSATGTPSSTTFLRGDNSWATPAADLAWQSVQTTSFTAVAGRAYPVNTTSASITVTLPATPAAGNQVQIVDYAGTADTNAITINPNSNKIESGTASLQLKGEREGVILTYIDSTQGWIATSGINEGTDALEPITYSVDFLVIAGGGSGASYGNGGGGGAGGYRTSTQSVNAGTVITVTVGDGGASASNASGNNGSNSSISGSGLTTITSAGGGGGGNNLTTGNGGSGGGEANDGPAGVGLGNTPSTSPSQGNNGGSGNNSSPVYGAGGGGGAGAVGQDGTSSAGGNGGNGLASSITGSSVTRAGGGGGAIDAPASATTGGSGGGGAGGSSGGGAGGAGTVNTGSGGGGSEFTVGSGAGGKGVVILSMATASYSGTTTGSPTVTTSGANTILQFNGDGSYTA